MKITLSLSFVAIGMFSSGSASAKDHAVSQKGKAFAVEEITVAAGDAVTFKNDDETSHNVFSSTEGAKFNLGIQKPGLESSQKFATAGTFEVRCAIHPKMKLKVVVK